MVPNLLDQIHGTFKSTLLVGGTSPELSSASTPRHECASSSCPLAPLVPSSSSVPSLAPSPSAPALLEHPSAPSSASPLEHPSWDPLPPSCHPWIFFRPWIFFALLASNSRNHSRFIDELSAHVVAEHRVLLGKLCSGSIILGFKEAETINSITAINTNTEGVTINTGNFLIAHAHIVGAHGCIGAVGNDDLERVVGSSVFIISINVVPRNGQVIGAFFPPNVASLIGVATVKVIPESSNQWETIGQGKVSCRNVIVSIVITSFLQRNQSVGAKEDLVVFPTIEGEVKSSVEHTVPHPGDFRRQSLGHCSRVHRHCLRGSPGAIHRLPCHRGEHGRPEG